MDRIQAIVERERKIAAQTLQRHDEIIEYIRSKQGEVTHTTVFLEICKLIRKKMDEQKKDNTMVLWELVYKKVAEKVGMKDLTPRGIGDLFVTEEDRKRYPETLGTILNSKKYQADTAVQEKIKKVLTELIDTGFIRTFTTEKDVRGRYGLVDFTLTNLYVGLTGKGKQKVQELKSRQEIKSR